MEVGAIVKSKCGRDAGRVYCVLSVTSADFVELVNGRSRKLNNPKRKRIKHLEVLSESDLKHKIEQRQKIYDSDIITILNEFKNEF